MISENKTFVTLGREDSVSIDVLLLPKGKLRIGPFDIPYFGENIVIEAALAVNNNINMVINQGFNDSHFDEPIRFTTQAEVVAFHFNHSVSKKDTLYSAI